MIYKSIFCYNNIGKCVQVFQITTKTMENYLSKF